jgi:phospholipase/carboxylesterase
VPSLSRGAGRRAAGGFHSPEAEGQFSPPVVPVGRGRIAVILADVPIDRSLPSHQVRWLGDPRPDDETVPTLVLLHGFGSSEADLAAVVPAIGMFLPGVSARVLTVRGSHPAAGRRGYAWFPGPLMTQPPLADIARTGDVIADVIRRYTTSALLLGFSQGMAAAITTMRRHPDLVGALVGLSGYLYDDGHPGDGQLAVMAISGHGVPAFVGYDPADPRVPAVAREHAVTFLRTHSALEEHTYPGMGHSISMPEIMDAAAFLRRRLTARAA